MNGLIRLVFRSHLLMALLLTSGLLSVPTLSIAQPTPPPTVSPVSQVLDQQLVPSSPTTMLDTTSLNFYSYWKMANCRILTRHGAHARRRSLRSMLDPVGHGLIAAENLSSLRGVSQLLCLNNTGAFVLSCTRNDGSIWSRSSFACPSGEATDPITLFPSDCHGLHVSTMEGRLVHVPTPIEPAETRRAAAQTVVHPQPTLAAWTDDVTEMASLLNAEAESLPGYHQEDARALARTVLLGCDRAVNAHCPPTALAGTTAAGPDPTSDPPPDPTQNPAYLELSRNHRAALEENREMRRKNHQLKLVMCLSFAITLVWLAWQIFKRWHPTPEETSDVSAQARIAELEETNAQFIRAARTAEAQHNHKIAQINSAHATELSGRTVDEARRTAEAVANARGELEQQHAQEVAELTSRMQAVTNTNERLNRDLSAANAERIRLEAQAATELDRRTRAITENNSSERASSVPANNSLADVVRLHRQIVQLTEDVDRLSTERDNLTNENAGLLVANARLERALAETQPNDADKPTTNDAGGARIPSHTIPAGSGNPSSANPDGDPAAESIGEMERYATNRPPSAGDIAAMGRALITPEFPPAPAPEGERETADPASFTDHRSAIAPPPGDGSEGDLASLLGDHLRNEIGEGPDFSDMTAVDRSILLQSTEPAPRMPTAPGPAIPADKMVRFGIEGEAPDLSESDPDAATRTHDRASLAKLIRQSTTDAHTTQQINVEDDPDLAAAIAASRDEIPAPQSTDTPALVLEEEDLPFAQGTPRPGRNKTTLEMIAPPEDAAAARNGGAPSLGTPIAPPNANPSPDFQSGIRPISGSGTTNPGFTVSTLDGAPSPENQPEEFYPLAVTVHRSH